MQNGTYIRVSGTTRHADEHTIKELMFEGANKSFDQAICLGFSVSDEDIEHLHNTVSRILEIVKSFQLASAMLKGEDELAKVEKQVASYEQIKALISVDTLKTMQLLGFNYKAAIGEPLTQICADAISNIGNKNKSQQNGNKNKR